MSPQLLNRKIDPDPLVGTLAAVFPKESSAHTVTSRAVSANSPLYPLECTLATRTQTAWKD